MTTLPRRFVPGTPPVLPGAGRIGLRVFMGVATTLFSLLILAYAMRMREADWMPVPHPVLLWWNTGALARPARRCRWRGRQARGAQRGFWQAARWPPCS